MLMQNVATLKNKRSKTVSFDIKGSTIRRFVKLNDKSVIELMKNKYNLKDLNYLQINKIFGKTLLNLNDETALKYIEVAERDSQFLCSHGLMDYSMLLVIEQHTTEQSTRINDSLTLTEIS